MIEINGSKFIAMIFIAMIISLYTVFPKLKITRQLRSLNVEIVVKTGDIFDEKGHLVIGMSDTFDTEIGDIIKRGSIQGQFLEKIYENDRKRLDSELAKALSGIESKTDVKKFNGKQDRYSIGTVATIGSGRKMYFCSAYSYMKNDLTTCSDYKKIWHSLNQIWDEIRLKGQGTEVSIAVIGSDLSRTGIAYDVLLKMIIISFVLATKTQLVTKKFNVIVYPGDYEKVDMDLIEYYLNSLSY